MKRPAFTLIELIVTVIIVALLCDVFMRGGGIAVLCLGWIPRTVWLLYRLLVHTPLVIPAAIVGFFVAATMLHFPIRLFRKDWKYRQSVAVAGLMAGVFVTLVGLSTAFDLGNELYRPNQAIRKSVDYQRWLRRSGETMKRWAASSNSYAAEHDDFLPLGGTVLEDGRAGHGWITQLLPYMKQEELYAKIDLEKPWNAPENDAVYKGETEWHQFRSGKSKYEVHEGKWSRPKNFYKNEDGYQLTDYAANERILGPGRSPRLADISDGLSQTILFGEAAENLQPWGSPLNCRDPALGVNRSPFGFGYASPNEWVNFVMCDGSIKIVSEKVAPEILRALATPRGGEPSVDEEVLK